MKAKGADPNAGFAINGYIEAMAITAGLKACGYPCSSAKLVTAMQGLGSVDTQGVTAAAMKYSDSYFFGLTGGKFYAWDKAKKQAVPVSGFLPIASS